MQATPPDAPARESFGRWWFANTLEAEKDKRGKANAIRWEPGARGGIRRLFRNLAPDQSYSELARLLAEEWEAEGSIQCSYHEGWARCKVQRFALDIEWKEPPADVEDALADLITAICRHVASLVHPSMRYKYERYDQSVWWNASSPQKLSFHAIWPDFWVSCDDYKNILLPYVARLMREERFFGAPENLIDTKVGEHKALRLPLCDGLDEDGTPKGRTLVPLREPWSTSAVLDAVGLATTEHPYNHLYELVQASIIGDHSGKRGSIPESHFCKEILQERAKRQHEKNIIALNARRDRNRRVREVGGAPLRLNFVDDKIFFDSEFKERLAERVATEDPPFLDAFAHINSVMQVRHGPGDTNICIKIWDDEFNLPKFLYKSIRDFKNTYTFPTVEVDTGEREEDEIINPNGRGGARKRKLTLKLKSIFELWLASPERNETMRHGFKPLSRLEFFRERTDEQLKREQSSYFNTFRGFEFWRRHPDLTRLRARWGNTASQVYNKSEGCRTIIRHVVYSLANGNFKGARVLLYILANIIQRPWDSPQKNVVLFGGEGVGKTSVLEKFCERVLGMAHSRVLENARDITGEFNELLSGIILLIIEEAFFSGDHKAAAQLQAMLTGKFKTINGKNKTPFQEGNYINTFTLTNQERPVKLNDDARRHLLLRVNDLVKVMTEAQKANYFNALNEALDGEGMDAFALFLELLPLDEEWMQTRRFVIVETEGLASNKIHSLRMTKPTLYWW